MKPLVLFYSTYCGHSEQAVAAVTKYSLKPYVALLCIDAHRGGLPPWVDCVPLIMDRRNNQVYRDADVFALLDKLAGQQERDVVAYCGQGSSYSDGFSTLDGQDCGHVFNTCYSAIEDQMQITTPQDDSPFVDKSNKNDVVLENLLAERDSQLQSVFGGQPRQRIG